MITGQKAREKAIDMGRRRRQLFNLGKEIEALEQQLVAMRQEYLAISIDLQAEDLELKALRPKRYYQEGF